MNIQQLRYFTRVVELGGIGKAALDLGVVTSALSQQISRLESELSTRLLQRTSMGVIPTDAGIAFFRQAQLALRHIDEAARAAQQARLSGHVSVGMAPTTAAAMGVPLIRAMRERYPSVRFHLVESLSGHLVGMLNARQLDLAIVFDAGAGRRWSIQPLLDEQLFVMAAPGFKPFPGRRRVPLKALAGMPLVMPTSLHGLRVSLEKACQQQGLRLDIALEVDSLAVLMDAVSAGYVATVQPGAAVARLEAGGLRMAELSDEGLVRHNLLASLSDEELSPAALATRVVMRDVALQQLREGRWLGARAC